MFTILLTYIYRKLDLQSMIRHKYLRIIRQTIQYNSNILTQNIHSSRSTEIYSVIEPCSLNLHTTIQYFSTSKDRKPTIDQSEQNYKKYNLQIQQVNPQNVDQCIDLASRNFAQFQPQRQAFNIKYPSPLSQRISLHNQYFQQWKDEFLTNQLSKVAYQKDDTNNRQIIKSVMLAKDYSYVPPNISSYMNDFNIFSALNALYAETKKAMQPQWAHILNQTQRGIVAHFWLGATVPQLASAKIFSKLMVVGEQKAIQKGYKYIVVWATNNTSGKISQKLNYKCISSVDTHSLQVFGQRPFELTPQKHRFCCVWGKQI